MHRNKLDFEKELKEVKFKYKDTIFRGVDAATVLIGLRNAQIRDYNDEEYKSRETLLKH